MDNRPFEITVIGSAAAMPVAGKYHSSHVVNIRDHLFLLDCGEGSQKAMLECGINPLRLKAIFITHIHGDHMYGLFPLLDTLSLAQRSQPLKVFAPTPLGELMDCMSRTFYGQPYYGVEFHEVDTTRHQMLYEEHDIEVWTVPLIHRVPSTGYLFREKAPGLNVRKDMIQRYALDLDHILAAKRGEDITVGGILVPNRELTYIPYTPRSYAYCTDTLFSKNVAEMVRGVDLLYHEATFAAADGELAKINGHSTTEEAAGIARQAGAGRLIIGHISARYKDVEVLVREAREVFPNTEAAVEGCKYLIENKIISKPYNSSVQINL